MTITRIECLETRLAREDHILPFIDQPTKIFQGHNGPHSHFAMKRGMMFYDHRYALDFELPLETDILVVVFH